MRCATRKSQLAWGVDVKAHFGPCWRSETCSRTGKHMCFAVVVVELVVYVGVGIVVIVVAIVVVVITQG